MEDLINIISEIATPYLKELINEFKEYLETLNSIQKVKRRLLTSKNK